MGSVKDRLVADTMMQRSALSAGINEAIGRTFNIDYYEPNSVLGPCWRATRVSDGLPVLIKPLPVKTKSSKLRRRNSLWASRGSPASFGIERLDTHFAVLTPIWTFATEAYGELGVFDVADSRVMTLDDYLRHIGNALSEPLVRTIFTRIAMAVGFLHRRGGDGDPRAVCTRNVLIDPRRGIVLAGYDSSDDAADAMSPVIEGPPLSSIEEEKDIFMLGTILYALLTKKPFPAEAATDPAFSAEACLDDVPSDTSDELRTLLRELLRRDEQRTVQHVDDILMHPIISAAADVVIRDQRRLTTGSPWETIVASPPGASKSKSMCLRNGEASRSGFWLQG